MLYFVRGYAIDLPEYKPYPPFFLHITTFGKMHLGLQKKADAISKLCNVKTLLIYLNEKDEVYSYCNIITCECLNTSSYQVKLDSNQRAVNEIKCFSYMLPFLQVIEDHI